MASADNSMETKQNIPSIRRNPGPPDKKESQPRHGRRWNKEKGSFPRNGASNSLLAPERQNVGRGPREKEPVERKKSGRGRNWNQVTDREEASSSGNLQRGYGRPNPNRNRNFRQRNDSNCYNKELFVQASCQFVVSDKASYKEHMRDPDLPIDWSLVEEIRILVEERLSCPICLHPPVAGRITRCGHVYCWPCITHYLSLSDKTWRKCPICYESVYANQLKPVRENLVSKLKAGLEIEMVLMKRQKGFTRALPSELWELMHKELDRFKEEVSGYDKLVLITEAQVLSEILTRERRELELQMETEGTEPEACFTVSCLNELNEKEHNLRSGRAGANKPVELTQPITIVAPLGSTSPEPQSPTYNVEGGLQTDGGSKRSPRSSEEDKAKNNSHFYFYQAGDGQLIFLHSVNARALQTEYGSLEKGPSRIKGEILQLEYFCMNETLRKRYRYLSHLPLTSSFALAEIKFKQDILSNATISAFADETKRRKEMRKRRERDDEARDRLAEKWNRALLLDPGNEFLRNAKPGSEIPDIPVVTYVGSAQQEIQALNNSPPNSEEMAASPPEDLDRIPSFASMLRTGKPKNAQRSQGWAVGPATTSAATVERAVENEDGEVVTVLGNYGDEFGAALQLALDSAQISGSKEKKGKKKKNKGTVVFSL